MKAWHATRKFWLELVALMAAAVLASVLVAPALGQSTSPLASGSPPCSPSLPPGSPGTATTGGGEPHNPATPPDNLSQRLAQSDGVICPPPAVDPEIRLPTPDAGRTPVIPPPGSPGGDPSIRPK
ncbi:MAG: hypothetical protein QOD94_2942 [Alphaproteobacteria bacterium]|nr:hypothetical protein [Alphaproteobacteria bacterium]